MAKRRSTPRHVTGDGQKKGITLPKANSNKQTNPTPVAKGGKKSVPARLRGAKLCRKCNLYAIVNGKCTVC